MAKSNRIAGAVLLSGLLMSGGLSLRSQEPGDDPERSAARTEPGLSLPTDPAGEKKLAAVGEYVRQQAWTEATQLLQSLLDGPDAFVPVKSTDGKEVSRWTTLYVEANRLFCALPAPGRETYERAYGAQVKARLAEANQQRDPFLLAEVSRRYLHTTAGAEATRLLGIHYLDRGRHAMAAHCFERLLQLPDVERLSPSTLFTATLAFQRAGDRARADQAWKKLVARAPGGLRLGDKVVSLTELQALLAGDGPQAREATGAAEWMLFRGDAARSARGIGGDFVPEARWRRDTVHENATRTWLQEAIRLQEVRLEPVLPAFLPVATRGRVVYRSHRGIHAVDAASGKPLWEFESEGSLDTLALDLNYFPYVESWVNAHLQPNPHVLFGNPVVGALSTDGARVYAVEDLAIPPYQNTYHYRGRPIVAHEFTFTAGLTEAVRHSRLIALDLKSGKLVWERGRPESRKHKDDLHPSYFLGPPLPVGGKLYGLLEKDQELRLVCLDATDGKTLWTLPLGVTPARLLVDPARRIQAVHLAYAEGILLCPTNTGFLLAVDPVNRCFLWANAYREPSLLPEAGPPPGAWGGRGRSRPTPVPPPVLRPHWTASTPVVQDGKVIFTTPDDPSVRCLRLRDGALLWKQKRTETDLYLAGASHGKVLLVGKQTCRALDLASGKQLWETQTGMPSGLGTTGEKVYYLPVKATVKDRQPAVLTIDLDSGRLRTETTPARNEVPGNLIFYQDAVLSQTAATITAYPRRGPE